MAATMAAAVTTLLIRWAGVIIDAYTAGVFRKTWIDDFDDPLGDETQDIRIVYGRSSVSLVRAIDSDRIGDPDVARSDDGYPSFDYLIAIIISHIAADDHVTVDENLPAFFGCHTVYGLGHVGIFDGIDRPFSRALGVLGHVMISVDIVSLKPGSVASGLYLIVQRS